VELWDDALVLPPAVAARAAVLAYGDELLDLHLPDLYDQWRAQWRAPGGPTWRLPTCCRWAAEQQHSNSSRSRSSSSSRRSSSSSSKQQQHWKQLSRRQQAAVEQRWRREAP
jgi:hypothetical protein